MKIKEFELDLPYVENKMYVKELLKSGIEHDEATRIDYQKNWLQKRRDFQLKTRCITSMIARIMKPIVNDQYWKILIQCRTDYIESSEAVVRNLNGVLSLSAYFDLHTFYGMCNYQKKMYIVDFILKTMETISPLLDIDISNVVEACYYVIDRRYNNLWTFHQKLNKEKDLLAKVLVEHDVDTVNIVIEITDDSSLIKRICLYQTLPDERAYAKLLGKIQWKNNRTLLFISKQDKRIIHL